MGRECDPKSIPFYCWFCIGSGAGFKASNIQGKFTSFTDYCDFQ